jgi:hypothetical protein
VPSPDDLRRRAVALERQAADLRRKADEYEASISAALRAADSAEAALPSPRGTRIINRSKMNVDTSHRSKNMKIGASRSRREHPAMRAWYEAGKTITDIAGEIGEKRPRVSAWLASEPTSNRPIPLRVYGVSRAVWQRIAT